MLSSRINRLFFGFLSAAILETIIASFYGLSESGSTFHRVMTALGGNFFGGGYIQAITYFAFFWGMFEIRWFFYLNKKERRFFSYDILPTDEFITLDAHHINKIRLKVSEYLRDRKYDNERKFYLARVINKACTKFRSNQSISETFEVVASQCRINATKAESKQSLIRYVAWAIPSIGFVGTILGISQSLVIANSGDIETITATLGVAFDTTLIALILSLVLMFFVHNLQEDTEHLHTDVEEYVVDKFINRIDIT